MSTSTKIQIAHRPAVGSSRLIRAGLSVCFLLATFLYGYVAISIRQTERSAPALLVDNRPAVVPTAPWERLVWWGPLRPQMVNAAFVAEARQRGRGANASAADRMLRGLGWRNTSVLQNRLILAADAKDLAEIVQLADALLRRQKLVEQTSQLLLVMEQSDKTRRYIVTAMGADPIWREEYLRRPLPRASSSEVFAIARASLFRQLIEGGANLTYDEQAAVVRGLFDAGAYRLAYRAYLDVNPADKENLINRYNTFIDQSMDRSLPKSPFNWNLADGVGVVPNENGQRDARILVISGSSDGSEVLAERFIYLPSTKFTRRYVVELRGSPAEQVGQLRLAFDCGGALSYGLKVGTRSLDKSLYEFNNVGNCEVANLKIYASAGAGVVDRYSVLDGAKLNLMKISVRAVVSD